LLDAEEAILSHRRLLWTWALVIALATPACGPIWFVSQVSMKAERAVAAAKLHQADKYSPYEYFGAEAYLDQAKYRAGYGDYQTSYKYGKKAEAMADKAVKISKAKREEERDMGGKPTLQREPPSRP
jgi:hypothetical protein